jgi:hypothetical protein
VCKFWDVWLNIFTFASTQTSVFVPSEGNALADILLARGVNGDSPIKKRAPRKSVVTPKPRAPAASKEAARTKTPRTGTSKRGTRKSIAAQDKKENILPVTKKRGGTSKTAKVQKSRTNDGAPFVNLVVHSLTSPLHPTL